MAECKYPNAVCSSMTVLNKVAYCDSVPCALKEQTTKQTNADKIRNMTDEELADFLDNNVPDCARLCPDFKAGCFWSCKHHQGKDFLLKWLQSEAE